MTTHTCLILYNNKYEQKMQEIYLDKIIKVIFQNNWEFSTT